ncbi:hypothetical protein K469DRAFT_744063 [Zopfia rhizophila CBS 207.26]|uniref:Uncharacterized protein n=1 Tax=Zopfia rhizophila CBS 207.26 TaxID=1314779 RepID=A0A6A6EXG5_9PEZI|nr:hypothetical protein K469DRAFT_744063 [Zopfia rhizophila CBS 207.26]
MFSWLPRVLLSTMLLTGVLLASTIRADALSDLEDLRTIISTVASTVGAPTNSSRNWGFLPVASESLGTADLIGNITGMILRAQYDLNVDQNAWVNGTQSLDGPYIEYVSAIPNLSTALTALGRSWHRELNHPVWTAVDALQQSIGEFSSALLQANLTHSNSTIRTIRASSTLEDAQMAWSRILNLPGSASGGPSERRSPAADALRPYRRSLAVNPQRAGYKRSLTPAIANSFTRAPIWAKARWEGENGENKNRWYAHKDLWGRAPDARRSGEGLARPYDGVVRQKEKLAPLHNGFNIDNVPSSNDAKNSKSTQPTRLPVAFAA